jgi:uncharacterized protein (TIGR02996 family)
VATAEQEQAAFLAAILAAPEDDTPRLVYADWLEEHGEVVRAEFIRVQVELAGVERRAGGLEALGLLRWDHPWRLRAKALRRRERELDFVPPAASAAWCWPLAELHLAWSWTMRRGLAEEVTCTCRDWLAHGPAVVAAQPVTRVALRDQRPWHAGRGGGREFFAWYLEDDPPTPGANLPAALFKALPGIRRAGDRHAYYRSPGEALDDLSAACLAWARGKRGL